ncbi:MAG: hypothetical protein J6S79_09450 [Lachnospiraceae bacterium]|nr:hypothetical protein [Lachnospiraceae bacterium]
MITVRIAAAGFVKTATSLSERLNRLYNWLNNEGVLKSERLTLYTYTGQELKNAFGKKRIRTEEKLMSIFLKDLDINESNKLQFSKDRLQIGGRWLDDIVGNIS